MYHPTLGAWASFRRAAPERGSPTAVRGSAGIGPCQPGRTGNLRRSPGACIVALPHPTPS